MMMIKTAINILMQVSALVVLLHAMGVINKMNYKTCHLIRTAYILIAAASLSGVLAPVLTTWRPHLMCAIGMLGIAVLFIAERRRISHQSQKTASIHVINNQRHGVR